MVYEDAMAIAFLDIQPVNPGHVLVVPREHYETVQEVPRRSRRAPVRIAARLIPVVQAASGART